MPAVGENLLEREFAQGTARRRCTFEASEAGVAEMRRSRKSSASREQSVFPITPGLEEGKEPAGELSKGKFIMLRPATPGVVDKGKRRRVGAINS